MNAADPDTGLAQVSREGRPGVLMPHLADRRAQRRLRAALEPEAGRVAAGERPGAWLRRLLEVSGLLARSGGVEDAWPRLMSLAAEDLPLRAAILALSTRDPGQPLVWWRTKVSATGRRRAPARVRSLRAVPKARPGSPPAEGLRAVHRLSGPRGDVLGTLQLEWSAAPGEADLAFVDAFAGQIAADLDRRAREEALQGLCRQSQRAARAREELLATVSHELENLLFVISPNLALLLGSAELQASEACRGPLMTIRQAGDRMRRLVRDLLDVACIQAEHLVVVPRRVEVGPLVAEAVEAARLPAELRSLRIQTDVPATLPAVRADPTRIQQVFANLLINATKLSPEGGTISVRAEPCGGEVRFSVADGGPGIAPEDLPHLFERFGQAKHPAGLGIGLGLFITRGIVKAHGGRIWVESQVGAGSTFFFTVPAAGPRRSAPARPRARQEKATPALSVQEHRDGE